MKKISSIIYLIIVISLLMFLGLHSILHTQTQVSIMENRNLKVNQDFEGTSFIKKTFQDTLEDLLSDQFFIRNNIVTLKKKMDQYVNSLFVDPNIRDYKLTLISEANRYRIGDSNYLMYGLMKEDEEIKEKILDRVDQINNLQEVYPNIDVYVYRPIQAHELNIFDEYNDVVSYGVQYNQLIKDNLEVSSAFFEIQSLDDYKDNFYASDHHWNYAGSYEGYLDIHELLNLEDESLIPNEIVTLDDPFYGTHANFTGRIFGGDQFSVYTFDYKPFQAFKNEDEPCDYHYPNNFVKRKLSEDEEYYYSEAYDLCGGMCRLTTNDESKENILVVGVSYMGPVSSLIAQHFNNSYFLTPTGYYQENGKIFNYKEFLDNHEIDKILFMYTIENYFYEDEWGKIYRNFDIILEEGK